MDKIQSDRMRFTELLKNANLEISDVSHDIVKRILELAMSAKSLWKVGTPDERLQYLKKVSSNPVLEAPIVRYELKKTFRILSEMKRNGNWRPQVDDFRTACIELATHLKTENCLTNPENKGKKNGTPTWMVSN